MVTRVLQWGTLISTLAFIGSTLVQIYARFFMDSAPSWTEETARMFFIYAMSFAAGLALKDDLYVHLDLIYNRLGPVARKSLEKGILLLIAVLFGIIGWYSIQLIGLGLGEKSPSLGVSMALAFSSMFVMSAGVVIFSLVKLSNRA